jgi:7tm Chemosensory receptor
MDVSKDEKSFYEILFLLEIVGLQQTSIYFDVFLQFNFLFNSQACKLAQTVNQIQINLHDAVTFEVRELLHSFMFQASFYPVTFTAFGFFTLDLKLLASIVTGILSYLIILVQFYKG